MESTRHKIILVDDNIVNLDTCRKMLRTFYEAFPAVSAAKLYEILESIMPDLILLDIDMPDVDGFEVIKRLKSDVRFSEIPVIFLTACNETSCELEGFDLGASDFISKPFSAPVLLKRIENQLLIVRHKRELLASQAIIKDYAENLEKMVQRKTQEVVNLQGTILATIANLVEFRDKATGCHITRTTKYLETLLNEMHNKNIYREEIDEWNVDYFLHSALLHDVGKIAITDLILNKPDKLSPNEFDIIKTHVCAGVEVIENILSNAEESGFLRHALLIAGTHHEKWDGTGYPLGLKGKNIPLEGRLMAVADVFDALVSERPYKKAFSPEEAIKIIRDGSGTHFDPEIVEVFISVTERLTQIAQIPETGENLMAIWHDDSSPASA